MFFRRANTNNPTIFTIIVDEMRLIPSSKGYVSGPLKFKLDGKMTIFSIGVYKQKKLQVTTNG
jgi:hypothetical protein